MNRAQVFEAWAPERSPWSAWAKPVSFAWLRDDGIEASAPLPHLTVPAVPVAGTAIIVDLPGKNAVLAGVALAAQGFRPVPLFNALPGSDESLVDVVTIQEGLVDGVARLEALAVPSEASPAFVLDALRSRSRHRGVVGRFDNRSVTFPSDFPSPQRLLAAGLSRVRLLLDGTRRPSGDLVRVLVAFRAAGLEIDVQNLAEPAIAPVRCTLPRFAVLQTLWLWAWVPLFLRRKSGGEFGGMMGASG
jgi:hypothetical protein